MIQFGKYEIVHALGAGGMAIVHRARDTVLGRDVALKVISERLTGGDVAHKRFLNEARVIASLTHPNIVVVYDLGIEAETPFIAMEYLPGCDLRDLIDQAHPLSLEQRVDIMLQVARALEHAHQNGIIHRDVKPGNVRVMRDGRVKLMDFGIAKFSSAQVSKLTQTGMVLGSVSYMSPEQVRGQEVSTASDVFAFGVVFYELLTGRLPFVGGDSMTTLWKITFEAPDPFTPAEVARHSETLRGLVTRCLAKTPELRFRDFHPVIDQLGRMRRLGLLGEFAELEEEAPWIPLGVEDRIPPEGGFSSSLPFRAASDIESASAPTEVLALPPPPPLPPAPAPAPAVSPRRATVFAALAALTAISIGAGAAIWLPGPSVDSPLSTPLTSTSSRPPSPLPSSPLPLLAQLPASPGATAAVPPLAASEPPSSPPRTGIPGSPAAQLTASRGATSRPSPALTPRRALGSSPSAGSSLRPTRAPRPDPSPTTTPVAKFAGPSRAAMLRALEARQRLGQARAHLPRLAQTADNLLRDAQAALDRGSSDVASEGFSRAEALYRDTASLAARVLRAQDLERDADYAGALEQLAPIFQLHPDVGEPATALRSRLQQSRARLEAALDSARLALDRGEIKPAARALDGLPVSEQAIPQVHELRRRIEHQIAADRQPPDILVLKLDYRVGSPLLIEVRVIDTSGIAAVTLYSECSGENGFQASALAPAGSDLFNASIEPRRHQGKAIRYYLEAVDQAGNRKSLGSAKKPTKLKSEAAFSIAGPPG